MKKKIEKLVDDANQEIFKIDYRINYNSVLNLRRAILLKLALNVLKLKK